MAITFDLLQGKPADYEFSELLLYEASIMVEAGKFKEALTHIYSHRDSILDIQSWLEMAGLYLLVLVLKFLLRSSFQFYSSKDSFSVFFLSDDVRCQATSLGSFGHYVMLQ